MARGSLLAGIAFGAAGTHLSHAIQYPVGAMTKTPHGLGTGALLPYVLQALLPAIASTGSRTSVSRSASSHPATTGPPQAQAQDVVDAIAALCARIGLPVALSELGVDGADVPHIVDLTLQVEAARGDQPRSGRSRPAHPDRRGRDRRRPRPPGPPDG